MGRKQRYSHPKRQTLVVRLLEAIEAAGPGGMAVTKMSELLWGWSHPDIPFDKKQGRSRWHTHFYGNGSGRRGLLNFYCKKVGRKWARNSVPHNYFPWHTMNAAHNAVKPLVLQNSQSLFQVSVTP